MKYSGMRRGTKAVRIDNKRVDAIEASSAIIGSRANDYWSKYFSYRRNAAKPDNFFVNKLAEEINRWGGPDWVATRWAKSMLWNLGYKYDWYPPRGSPPKNLIKRAYRKARKLKKQAGVA